MMHLTPLIVLVCLAPGISGSEARAPSPESSPESTGAPEQRPLRDRWREGWEHLKEDGRYLVTFPRRRTKEGLVAASAVGAGVLALVLLDDEIRAGIQTRRSPSLDRWERRIEPLGHLRNTTLAAAAVYGAGRLGDREGMAETGRSLLEALLFTEAFDAAAKGLFGRESPGPGARAKDFFGGSSFFPSGHTARAFAFATVLAERHGRPAASIAYPLAYLVGLSRLERDVHWASDVLAGAALGHAVARAVGQRRAVRASGARRMNFLPVICSRPGETEVALALHWEPAPGQEPGRREVPAGKRRRIRSPGDLREPWTW